LKVAGGINIENKSNNENGFLIQSNLDIKDNIDIGMYPYNKMRDFYKDISCYLVPDKFAGGPFPVLEAGAMGIPVVCTNAGLCGDFIENDVHGKIIETYEEFIDAIKWMKCNPKERKNMGLNLKEYIREQRTWEAVANYWKKFFND
jgi:glycosyltransferase involved in cell wall biosynthesis